MLQPIAKSLARAGAVLFLVGLLTGIWTAAALTGKVTIAIPHLALAAHLNGLLGGLWLIAVSATLPHLHYGPAGLKRLCLWTLIPSWANWLLTLVASILGVSGLAYTGQQPNDTLAFLLQAAVVLPSLVGASLWVWGFR